MLNKKDYIILLVRFLKELNIYHPYVINMRNYIDALINDTHIHNFNPYYLISDYFDWTSTNEGFDFWENISTKWENYYQLNIFKKIR